jgi:hypothetical protein
MDDEPHVDWPRIIAIALKADADLGSKYSKADRTMRSI